jgi:hydroxyacylglutathione hydrolase
MTPRLFRWLLPGWLGVAAAQGSLQMRWDPGAEICDASKQLTQLHAIDEVTIVIRQNPCIDFEANLLYLLIGGQRALLIDSGASDDPRLTAELTGLVSRYLQREDGTRLPLVVAHTHGHQDHRAGDAAFTAQPQTTVVPHDGAGMRKFFGFEDWPRRLAKYELGNREIVLAPTPGHHADHVVFYDPRTGLLFTGDFLLPGRLLVEDIGSYAASALLMGEVATVFPVRHALGAHIEMDTAGELYASGATFHPDERQIALPFELRDALELRQALEDFNGFYARHPNYVIVNPIRNLIVLAAGVLVALVMLVWLVRRLRRGIRARRAAA